MSYSVNSVANAFLHLARKDKKALTHMQLQKLCFFAHAFHLA